MIAQAHLMLADLQVNDASIPAVASNSEKTSLNQIDADRLDGFDNIFGELLSDSPVPLSGAVVVPDQASTVVSNSTLPPGGNILPISSRSINQPDMLSAGPLPEDVLSIEGIDKLTDQLIPGQYSHNSANTTAYDLKAYQSSSLQNYIHLNSEAFASQKKITRMGADNISLSAKDSALLDMDNTKSTDVLSSQLAATDNKPKQIPAVAVFEMFSRQLQQNRSSDKVFERFDTKRLVTDVSLSEPALVGSINNGLLDVKSPGQLTLSQPVTSPNWVNEFSDRVRWLVNNQVQKAELSLNPRNLGNIEVSISVNNDQTSIQIVAQNALSKEAVEGSLGRLREMLDESGINLVDVDVSQHSKHDSDSNNNDERYTEGHDEVENHDEAISEQLIPVNHGLVDFYA